MGLKTRPYVRVYERRKKLIIKENEREEVRQVMPEVVEEEREGKITE